MESPPRKGSPLTFVFPQHIYPIVGDSQTGSSCVEKAEAVLSQGVKLIQLREKSLPTGEFVAVARILKALCDSYTAQLVINDRIDIAILVGADGVHLGQDDLAPSEARPLLQPGRIIGFSTHSATQMEAAVRDGAADYLAFGPIFPTQSKQNPAPATGLATLRRIRQACPLPLVAIGGIDRTNLGEVLSTGVDAVAVIGAISGAADPRQSTADLLATRGAFRTR